MPYTRFTVKKDHVEVYKTVNGKETLAFKSKGTSLEKAKKTAAIRESYAKEKNDRPSPRK